MSLTNDKPPQTMLGFFKAWLRETETEDHILVRRKAFQAGWEARKRLTYEQVMECPTFGRSTFRKTLDNLLQ